MDTKRLIEANYLATEPRRFLTDDTVLVYRTNDNLFPDRDERRLLVQIASVDATRLAHWTVEIYERDFEVAVEVDQYGWPAFAQIPDVFAALAAMPYKHAVRITRGKLIKVLEEHGAVEQRR